MRGSLSFVLPALLLTHVGIARAQSSPSLFTPLGNAPIETFTLVDQDGKPFSPEQLRGKVWIAHFFFTACTQGCDKTIARMKEIEKLVSGKSDIKLVSFSVNPSIDTPELLKGFAEDLKADPAQWTFVTGSPDDMYRVVKERFKQNAVLDPAAPKDKQVTHDFRLLVLDREGRIVGYTDGRDAGNVVPLVERVRSIASERYVLPSVNAMLNGLAAFLLIVGYAAIKRRREFLHKGVMLAALTCSAVFLASYLYYHFAVLKGQSPRMVGPGAIRTVYLAILLSHTILAVVVAPLAIFVAIDGLKNNRPRHVRIARWTLPIWLYVSITGVVVYGMLYHLYPPY